MQYNSLVVLSHTFTVGISLAGVIPFLDFIIVVARSKLEETGPLGGETFHFSFSYVTKMILYV